MLDNVRSRFSISDLSQLTGVSMHTIRMWERRYQLLKPERSETNIRTYGTMDLKKLLNAADLKESGYKISEIAEFTEEQIIGKLKDIQTASPGFGAALTDFKVSMYHFDRFLFEKTYNDLLQKFSFKEIFIHAFLPLLDQIGNLWQTDIISPINEHFISSLVRQKLFLNIERHSYKEASDDNLYLLFLPLREIHEIGLLFIHYMLLESGKNSVYMGTDLPATELISIEKAVKTKITYVSYWTINPVATDADTYLKNFNNLLIKDNSSELWITGRKAPVELNNLYRGIQSINKPEELLKILIPVAA